MILVDGQAAQALDLHDRSIHYGDGHFTTLVCSHARPLLLPQHLQRLQQACRALAMPLPDNGTLTTEIQQLCHGQEAAVIKVILSRGVGGQGYRPDPKAPLRRIVMRKPWPAGRGELREQGVAVGYCRTPLGLNPTLAGLKHLNRLEQVQAGLELQPHWQEGLMCDLNGQVVEGTMSNLFLIREGKLITPLLEQCGVKGVMRAQILRIAAELDLEVVEQALQRSDIAQADELFLSNCVNGIWPIRELDGQARSIGAITRRLQQQLVEQGLIHV